MPEYSVSSLTIVNEIKRLLQDRYHSGFPILKELLQNADDAEARHFMINTLLGWPVARNPLLRVSGILVVNDGKFDEKDQKALRLFGESAKLTDSATIGKFGIGQKAVFHLCDAFVISSFGNNFPFSMVVNPFIKVEAEGNVTGDWESNDNGLAQEDLDLLLNAIPREYKKRCLIIWLPLRSDRLQPTQPPAPPLNFSSVTPSASQVIKDLSQIDELRTILTSLRYLRSIEIHEIDKIRCDIRVDGGAKRLLGPQKFQGERLFGGAIESTSNRFKSQFVGREKIFINSSIENLLNSRHWPTTISVLYEHPQRDKGEPHGAVTLSCLKDEEDSQLRISWAVFLPISESDDDIQIPLSKNLGKFNLLLHGWFFIDSGRRQIEGLTDPKTNDPPSEPIELGRSWNAELRDSVVLPLVPAVLLDALKARMVTSKNLTLLLVAIAESCWFRSNRRAICKNYSLVRVVEESGNAVWQVVPTEKKLRPLPNIITKNPKIIEKLFPDIHSWAKRKNVLLYVDNFASLTNKPRDWTSADLDCVFSTLSTQAFQSPILSELLSEFLYLIKSSELDIEVPTSFLVLALRKAMSDKSYMAHSKYISKILTHIPPNFLFPLPASVKNRQVLRALASVKARILPVRNEWMVNVSSEKFPKFSSADLRILLKALKPCVSSYKEEATLTALTFLVNSERGISELAVNSDFVEFPVLLVRDLKKEKSVALSLRELHEQKQEYLLFAPSPQSRILLRHLVEALPDISPKIVERNSDAYREIQNIPDISPQTSVRKGILRLVNKAHHFGTDDSRARLLQQLKPGRNDNPATFRKLCSGVSAAGDPDTKIWYLDNRLASLERTVASLITVSNSGYFVHSRVSRELSQQLCLQLDIQKIESQFLEQLLEQNLAQMSQIKPTSEERDAILKMDFKHCLVKRLPIHNRSDGTVGSLENVYFVNEWPVHPSLINEVLTLELSEDPAARTIQKEIVSVWNPESQIKTALSLQKPHLFRSAVLEAINKVSVKKIKLENSLLENLKEVEWLVSDDIQIKTQDALNLPDSVFEEAKKLLFNNSESPPFLPVQKLSIDVKEHPSFKFIEKNLLPDREESYEILEMMIEEAHIFGGLAPIDHDLVNDLKKIADENIDLQLPGWQLMANILRSMEHNSIQTFSFEKAFSRLSEEQSDIALLHLNSLANFAQTNPSASGPAKRIYVKGFEVVSQWREDVRRRVLRKIYVPTESGQWRIGRNVMVENEYGIAPSHVLAQDCAKFLKQFEIQSSCPSSSDHPTLPDSHRNVDLLTIECDSANEQRKFLQNFQGRVPSDLVINYLGLIGRFSHMKDVAAEWVNDATTELDTLWEKLDSDIESLNERVDRYRYILKTIDSEFVSVISLSGDKFDAPLNLQDSELELVAGNGHKESRPIQFTPTSEPLNLIYLSIRKIDVAQFGLEDVCTMFRKFVETVAKDCLHLESQEILGKILDRAIHIDQTTLDETILLLRDRLPTILEQLELPVTGRASKALRQYERKESKINRLSTQTSEIAKLKEKLWDSISDPEVTEELLNAVRKKIRDYGYSGNRVLFELLQNADDAYSQLEYFPEIAEFHVEVDSDSKAFRTIHWGRPINHLGSDAKKGYRLGRNRDLLNMLLMNFSAKKSEKGLTGKFGLGFKSVYMLSDSVGIASGFISLRTLGGFVPTNWCDGIEKVQKYSNSEKATVIDVPFSAESANNFKSMIQEFRASMFWVSAFASYIRRIKIKSNELVMVARTDFREFNGSGMKVVTVTGTKTYRALRLDLGDGYSILIRIKSEGPSKFPQELKCLWNFAPLEEKLSSVWILNGPFPVDPGRGRLAGSNEDRVEIFRKLGRVLGKRLVELSDFATRNWRKFSCALNLEFSKDSNASLFWSRLLEEVFAPDFDDFFTGNLHIGCGEFELRGYGALAFKRRIVPTKLPEPLDDLVCANQVTHFIDGAISNMSVLKEILNWSSLNDFKGRIVASQIADHLEILGFGKMKAIRLFEILLEEMGTNYQIDVSLGNRLGSVVTINRIENGVLQQEKTDLYRVSKFSRFESKDGSWRSVSELSSESLSEDENSLCQFAPSSAILHPSYRDTALEFFEVARSQSGYGPNSRLLHRWAVDATDIDRQVAVLRYIITGSQGQALAKEMRADRPDWLPLSRSECVKSLLGDWAEKHKRRLLFELYPDKFDISISPSPPDPNRELQDIHDWWSKNRETEIPKYEQSLYPNFFDRSKLRETHDRTTWFTMFALACFQMLGRTTEKQHRKFIERGWQDDWWRELADSTPRDNSEQWINRLEIWSAADNIHEDYKFLPWRRRTSVDLYTIARWLDEYVEIFIKLPRFIENNENLSLQRLLIPSYTPYVKEIDAAPIYRSLGVGANWLIRELFRHGVYDSNDGSLLAPNCWSSTQRVRNFLCDDLGCSTKFIGNMDESPIIYDFVCKNLGDSANFEGDFDLPLQIYSRLSVENRIKLLR